ncbi:MAG: hypothetical protein GDA38_18595 [Hormoscilla sp. SP12CHS1]|nr:hypothetical protein [Hormoscilla sp. SP12CHS1]
MLERNIRSSAFATIKTGILEDATIAFSVEAIAPYNRLLSEIASSSAFMPIIRLILPIPLVKPRLMLIRWDLVHDIARSPREYFLSHPFHSRGP